MFIECMRVTTAASYELIVVIVVSGGLARGLSIVWMGIDGIGNTGVQASTVARCVAARCTGLPLVGRLPAV